MEREGEYARESRAIYSSTIGVEINHIYSPVRRQWIYERMESEPEKQDQQRILDPLFTWLNKFTVGTLVMAAMMVVCSVLLIATTIRQTAFF